MSEGELCTRVCVFNPREWRGGLRWGWLRLRRWASRPGDTFWDASRDTYWVVVGGRPGRQQAIALSGYLVHAIGVDVAKALRPGRYPQPNGSIMIVEAEPLPKDLLWRS